MNVKDIILSDKEDLTAILRRYGIPDDIIQSYFLLISDYADVLPEEDRDRASDLFVAHACITKELTSTGKNGKAQIALDCLIRAAFHLGYWARCREDGVWNS